MPLPPLALVLVVLATSNRVYLSGRMRSSGQPGLQGGGARGGNGRTPGPDGKLLSENELMRALPQLIAASTTAAIHRH